MSYYVSINGTEVPVEVEADGGHYQVTLDDQRQRVDVREVQPGILSLLIDGCSHQVVVAPERTGYRVSLKGREVLVEVQDERARLQGALFGTSSGPGAGRITSVIPGRIVEVRVAPGDAVEVGQPVVILEAMKMENEVAAETAGTVVAVHVAPGDTVGAGDPLVEIERSGDDS